jgi:hypothetical protein
MPKTNLKKINFKKEGTYLPHLVAISRYTPLSKKDVLSARYTQDIIQKQSDLVAIANIRAASPESALF